MVRKRSKPLIEGVVIPSSWDENGIITGVSLHTSDEKEYQVQLNGLGLELLELVQHKVEATGKIRERLDGSRQIILNSYRKLTL
ncbi:MAG: hypothetical protein PVH56_15405 [Desulfobacterales bacterium]|jgi:hypothetical protein